RLPALPKTEPTVDPESPQRFARIFGGRARTSRQARHGDARAVLPRLLRPNPKEVRGIAERFVAIHVRHANLVLVRSHFDRLSFEINLIARQQSWFLCRPSDSAYPFLCAGPPVLSFAAGLVGRVGTESCHDRSTVGRD